MMLSESRREKDFDDAKAYLEGKKEMAYKKACKKYLRENPEVGTMIRNGKELFYINLPPLHKGRIKAFSPKSVIEIES